jgi:hypothetical protein
MRNPLSLILLNLFAALSFASDAMPPVNWPADKPALQFAVSKVNQLGTYQGQQTYIIDIAVRNSSGKKILQASFTVYLFDKQQVRIGQTFIEVANVEPNETVKMQVHAQTVGTPASFSVVPQRLPSELAEATPPKPIAVTVYSVPSGANLSVDGKELGVTPIAAELLPGSHTLTFSKEGYNPGTFPMLVSHDQLPGGSVSFELGSAAHDTVELRDGSVINGDVQSMDATKLVVVIGGTPQKFDRNKVKKVLLIEREPPTTGH